MQEGSLVSLLKVPTNGCHGLRLNVPRYTKNFVSNRKARNMHISVLKYDEKMGLPLSKQKIVKTFDDLKELFKNSIHENCVGFHSKTNLDCDVYLMIIL